MPANLVFALPDDPAGWEPLQRALSKAQYPGFTLAATESELVVVCPMERIDADGMPLLDRWGSDCPTGDSNVLAGAFHTIVGVLGFHQRCRFRVICFALGRQDIDLDAPPPTFEALASLSAVASIDSTSIRRRSPCLCRALVFTFEQDRGREPQLVHERGPSAARHLALAGFWNVRSIGGH